MEPNNTLNTSNPQAIIYQSEELRFTILGGIKLEGLDRLRVTIKTEVINRKFRHYLNNPDIADLALRQNLDLYNDTQVEKLIRKTAERLEIGSTAIAQSLAEITNRLEVYRLQQIEQSQAAAINKPKQLSEQEINQATDFLTAPNLIQRTSEAIKKSGVVGEEQNSLLMYIIFTSRKLSQPLHIISLGGSGTGKTHLQEKVSQLIPDEDKLEITSLSENAFYYFGQRELSNKLILIEDLDGATNVLFPLRELQSKRRISKTVTFKDSRGITKTITLTVEGPVSVSGCTTKERIYEDNANRSFLIYLDESETQDQDIMHYQKMKSAGLINTEEEIKTRLSLQNCQRILQPISIKNPYAPYLQLPKEVFKPRRTNKHYLDFIEAVTFYHQYQRTQRVDNTTGEVYIETTLEDIVQANKLMKEILLRKSDNISGACRNYFEKLKRYLKNRDESNPSPFGGSRKGVFTNYEARTVLRENHSNQKRYMLQLVQGCYVKRIEQKEKSKTYTYEIVSPEEYNQLQNSITTVLDEIIEKLKTVHRFKTVQNDNELSTPNKIRVKKKSSISSQEDKADLKNKEAAPEK